ncbi:MAG: DinB family protein [Bryobacteraceae bacterium]
MSSSDALFLDYSARKLAQYASRIEDCVGRLDAEQIWTRGTENENSVGNLVLHLSGNVRQWIVSGLGGRPDVRERDREFSSRGGPGVPELLSLLHAAVTEAQAVIRSIDPQRLTKQVRIQNYEVTVLEAIYHVVEHFSGHTGQIILATKLLTGTDLGYYKHLNAPTHSEKTV